MISWPEEMEYVADIRINAMLFHQWFFLIIGRDEHVRFCDWFGDHVSVPTATEVITITHTLFQIVEYGEINQRPDTPEEMRLLEESYRGHVQAKGREICDQIHAEGRTRFNLTVNL